MTAIIETTQLTKSYGQHRGIADVDLVVQEGEVFGFLGPNGAGKTTTIRLLLDLIRPTSGSARVFGVESSAHPVEIHRRVGYLPGEFGLYDRLTGGETLDYFANLRGGIDRPYQRALVELLDLDPLRRYREYSRGNKQKVALISALQHRPDLLILDEPTTGLDPLVQHEVFKLVLEARGDGRTVFFSSHVISEVERTCDRIAIIRDGRLVTVDRVEALRGLPLRDLRLRFAGPVPARIVDGIDGVTGVVAQDDGLRMQVRGPIGPVVAAAAPHGLLDVESREPSLEEIFLGYYGSPGADADAG